MAIVVRPRVLSPHSGEKLYFDDALEPLIQEGRPGPVCLHGPASAGKSTALEWLAGRLPAGAMTAILDDPTMERVAELADTMLVVYSARKPFGFSHRATFKLAPWGEDEVLDYLLATSRDRCASVLDRLRLSPEEGRPAWPEMWRVCLDVMAEDASVVSPRDALRIGVDRVLPPDARARARRICLERGIRGTPSEMALWSNRRFLSALAKRDLSEGALRFLRYGAVRQMLAAEQIVEDIADGRRVEELSQPPNRSLVLEAGLACAGRPEVLKRLKEIATGGEGTPMAASLLVAARSDWRPRAADGWYLKFAFLEGADWGGVNLHDARLDDARMDGAVLRGAVFDAARAHRTSLRNADLSGASLSVARFCGADLERAVLARATGGEVDFSDATLRGADFTDARLPGVLFVGATLDGAIFRDADLHDATFQDAKLRDVDFRGADLSGASLPSVDLRRTRLDGAHLQRVLLSNANLEGLVLEDADLSAARLVGASLTGSRLPRATLREAVLIHASLADVRWRGADLRGADLRECSFHLGTSRSGLVFGEPMQGSRTGFYDDALRDRAWRSPEEIRVADLRDVDLRAAQLNMTDFYRVDLRGAKLDPEQADRLRMDGAILE